MNINKFQTFLPKKPKLQAQKCIMYAKRKTHNKIVFRHLKIHCEDRKSTSDTDTHTHVH